MMNDQKFDTVGTVAMVIKMAKLLPEVTPRVAEAFDIAASSMALILMELHEAYSIILDLEEQVAANG